MLTVFHHYVTVINGVVLLTTVADLYAFLVTNKRYPPNFFHLLFSAVEDKRRLSQK